MQGWMLYRQKGGLVGRFGGFLEHKLYFILSESCQLLGFKDEVHIDLENPEVSFNAQECAVVFSQESTKQFEVIGDKTRNRVTFIVDNSSEVAKWVAAIQARRYRHQGDFPDHQVQLVKNMDEKKRLPRPLASDLDDANYGDSPSNNASSFNHEKGSTSDIPVFEDPLRYNQLPSVSNSTDQFEWDGDLISPLNNTGADTSSVQQLRKELDEAKENMKRYRERIASYQEVLASRDKQLFEVQDLLVSSDPNKSYAVADTEAYKSLEEQLKSYRDQNSLLNEEVLKLHERANHTRNELQQQQKKCKKIATDLQSYQRDFLLLLASCVHRPLVEPDDNACLAIPEKARHISTLKSLAHTVKVSHDRILGCSIPNLSKHEHFDAFGFVHQLPTEAIQVQYLALHLKDVFDAISETNEDNPKNLKKWRTYIRDHSDQFEVTSQLQKLIQNGVPTQYRAYIWQKMIHYYVADVKTAAGEGYFEDLLRHQNDAQVKKEFAKTLKQIAMDVPRTMPNNREFMAEGSPHQERLSRVLTAFCIHCTKIGYCQGFNFLAGGCLLFLEEEDAFWFLIAVTEKLFPLHYYHNGLSGLLADQYTLQDIISQVMPRLSQHLMKFPDVDLAAVTTGWFLGLFFDSLPFQTVIRVWDCFLAYGHEAMFRVACGVIKQFESELLEINEASQLLHAFKNIPKLCFHKEQLIKDSFNLPNFPPFEEIEDQRGFIEADLIDKHEEKVRQRKEFDERMILFDENVGDDFSWSFTSGAEFPNQTSGRLLLCANCSIAQNSQFFQVDFVDKSIAKVEILLDSRVMCMCFVTDDVILMGLFSRKLQACSLNESIVTWSMSLSDVVLCFHLIDDVLFVGTCDGKLHILQSDDSFKSKPTHRDSIELSKRPTTSLCLIPNPSCLWVASGPAIYVINTETYETDGFFLISTTMVQVCHMTLWRHSVSDRSMVWMAVRGSSVLQLRSASVYSGPPLLVYDAAKEQVLPSDLSKMPDNIGDCVDRVVSLSVWGKDQLWVGTGRGNIKVYQMQEKDDDGVRIDLKLIFSEQSTPRTPRCFLKTNVSDEPLLVICSGGYEDHDALSWWTEDGKRKEFSLAEDAAGMSSRSTSLSALRDSSATRMSDLASKCGEDGENLASSSESSLRSSESDQRPRRDAAPASPAGTEAWKSAMKNAAASAVRTYRDKKPAMKKFMNMLGGNQ